MRASLKRKLRHSLFYVAMLFMGGVIVESDIIMGRHCAEYMQSARVHYVEEPWENTEENEHNNS